MTYPRLKHKVFAMSWEFEQCHYLEAWSRARAVLLYLKTIRSIVYLFACLYVYSLRS